MMEEAFDLGIDIGGTKCAAVLGARGKNVPVYEKIKDKIAFPTDQPRGWKAILEELTESAETLLRRNGLSGIHAVGISCGGPLDSKKGLIQCPPNLPDWDNVPIAEIFQKRFHAPVRLQNDANACAVAEWKYGAGKGFDNLVFLTFGTGMGAGLILDGRLYSGAHDLAGEVGHMRLCESGPVGYGKEGSFEGFCSGGGIVRLAEHLARTEKLSSPLSDGSVRLSAKLLAEAAAEGDAFARRVYAVCAEKLGAGLSVLIDVLDVEAIVIGSIYQRSRSLFEKTVLSVIEKEALPGANTRCKILPSGLGDSLGDLAALSLCEE